MEIVIGWLVCSVVVGWVWSARGHDFGMGLIVSVLLSPLLGLIVGLVKAPNARALDERRVAAGDSKKCPFCAEVIKQEAVVCRFCGKHLSAAPAAQVARATVTRDERCSICGTLVIKEADGSWDCFNGHNSKGRAASA